MSELSKILGNAGAPLEVEANGKTYRIGKIDQESKTAYENALYTKAKAGIAELRDVMDKADYLDMLKELTAKRLKGEFALQGEQGKAVLVSPNGAGAILMLSILMGCNEMEVVQAMAVKEEELTDAFQIALRESFPGASFETVKPDAEVVEDATSGPKA